MTVLTTQYGMVDEVTYGTPVTVDHFFEYESESFKKNVARVESKGHRKNARVQLATRFEPYHTGASGSLVLDVPTKGFGILLKHIFGGSSIGSVTDSNYTQTHILATKTGLFFTAQVNRPFNAGTAQAHTFHGGKIISAEFACDRYGKLQVTCEMDFEDEDTSTALATASYTSDTRVFAWTGGSMTLDAGAVEIESFKLKISNPSNTGRHYLRTSTLKKEPLGNDMELVEWEFKMAHTALTTRNKVVAAARADALGAIVATFDGPIAHGGTTVPRIEFTIPAARFDDEDGLSVSSWDELSTTFSGIATDNLSAAPITCTYRTTDAAVV